MKKVFKYVFLVIIVAVVVVWAIAVYRINKAFPDATEYVYDSKDVCEFEGVEFVPEKCELLTVSEFEDKYNDYKYSELANNYGEENIKVIVLSIKLKNVSDYRLSTSPHLSTVYHEKSGFMNGCTIIYEDNIKLILNPGETTHIKLTTSVLDNNMKKYFFDNLKPEDISILIQTYPDRIKIDF
ncbi:MAG: hypothetical protein ACI4E1_04730 [Lachnospira sp.]